VRCRSKNHEIAFALHAQLSVRTTIQNSVHWPVRAVTAVTHDEARGTTAAAYPPRSLQPRAHEAEQRAVGRAAGGGRGTPRSDGLDPLQANVAVRHLAIVLGALQLQSGLGQIRPLPICSLLHGTASRYPAQPLLTGIAPEAAGHL